MYRHEKPYFMLFSAICDTIDVLEEVIERISDSEEKEMLQAQVYKLKASQKRAEEEFLSL